MKQKSRYSARQTAPLTFAIWDNVKNVAAIETTANGITAYMEIFGIDHIEPTATEPAHQPAEAPQTAAPAQQDEQTTATAEAAQDATQDATDTTENNTTPAQGTQEKRHQSRTERLEKLRRPYYTRLYPLWYKLMRPRLMPMQGPNTISWNLNHRME